MAGDLDSFDARQRGRVLEDVDGETFDLVVIGGGINGAGAARDAALRGLRVLLLEAQDLAFGTSSRSSKLIHGGLRYLEHYQFKLVFEGTNERSALRKIAPHLVRPLMFALPVYEQARHPLWLIDVGLWMYDSLSLFKVEQRHITLRSPKRMLAREPLLNPEGLTGGIIYYDCITDDARLTLENALSAAALGAKVLTQAPVTRVDSESRSNGVFARVHYCDRLGTKTGSVWARSVLNCTGPWTDHIRAMASVEDKVIRPTKGVHVVLDRERLPVKHAVALLAPQDSRVFFAIPWQGRSVLGTTDTDFSGDPSAPRVERGDVQYLLEAANHHFPSAALEESDVLSAWVGLRPLIDSGDEDASNVPREHRLFRDGLVVTIAGGKLTTYRRMAAEAVDAAVEVGGLSAGSSRTADEKLPGANGLLGDLSSLAEKISESKSLDLDIAEHLVGKYGSRSEGVIRYFEETPELKARICPDRPSIWAEVPHAVDHELALTVEDVLVRRTSLALTAIDQARGAAGRVADLMGARLGWDQALRQKKLDDYAEVLALTGAWREA